MKDRKQASVSFSSIFRTLLVYAISISPVLLIAVLVETLIRDAYPSDGDNIVIPFANYFVVFLPFYVVVVLVIDTRSRNDHLILLWNPKRNGKSLATLVLSALMFWFWMTFLLVSISVSAIGSAITCTLMAVLVPVARTLAIQDVISESKPRLNNLAWEDVDSRCAYLDQRYQELRDDLERLTNDEA